MTTAIETAPAAPFNAKYVTIVDYAVAKVPAERTFHYPQGGQSYTTYKHVRRVADADCFLVYCRGVGAPIALVDTDGTVWMARESGGFHPLGRSRGSVKGALRWLSSARAGVAA